MSFLAAALIAQQVRPGNFTIYAEPTAKLQTDAEIPFQIRVADDLNKPLVDAKVSLQIETADGRYVQVFKAPATDRGVYIAKPSFRAPGPWNVYITVDRNDRESSRTFQYNVPRSTE
jgi:hypothetical protein